MDDLASKFYFALLVTDMKVLSFINFQFILKHVKRGSFFRRKFLTNTNFKLFYLRKKFILKKVRFKYNFKKKHFSFKKSFFKHFLYSFKKNYSIRNKNFLKNYVTWYKFISRYYFDSQGGTVYHLRTAFPVLVRNLKLFLNIKPVTKQKNAKSNFRNRRYSIKSSRFLFKNRKRGRRKTPLFKFSHFLFLKLANLFFFFNYYKYILGIPFYSKKSARSVNFLKFFLSRQVDYFGNSKVVRTNNFDSIIKTSLIDGRLQPKIFLKVFSSNLTNRNKKTDNMVFLYNKSIRNKSLTFFFSDFYMGKFVGLMSSF